MSDKRRTTMNLIGVTKKQNIFRWVMSAVFGIESLPHTLIFEKDHYRFAQIYRNTFWEGIKTTYNLFVGNRSRKGAGFPAARASRMGLLDPILVFPLISRRLLDLVDFLGRQNFFPLGLVVLLVAAPMEIARRAFAVVLTLVVSPFVGLVHLIKTPKARELKERVLNTQVTLGKGESKFEHTVVPTNNTISSLGQKTKKVTIQTVFENDLGISAPSSNKLFACLAFLRSAEPNNIASFKAGQVKNPGPFSSLAISRDFEVNFDDKENKSNEREQAFKLLGLLPLR